MGRARTKARRRAEPAEAPARFPTAWAAFAIAVVTLVAYSSSFQNELVRDAAGLVQGDPRIRELSAANLQQIWAGEYWWGATGAAPLYRPVTTSSFLLNYALLGGEAPVGYHVLNLLLHTGNAWLVYALLRRLNAAVPAACLAAALFAVHPVATEAVTNIAGRADLLAAGAVLAGLVLHIGAPPAHPWRWRIALFAVTWLGLLSKENAAVLIVLAAAYDVLVRRAARRESYLVMALGYAAAFACRAVALADAIPYGDPLVDNPLRALPFLEARLTALKVVGLQLALLVWPQWLSADYSYDQIALFPSGGVGQHVTLAASVVALAGLVTAMLWLRRRQPALAFLAACLAIALLPTSNLLVLVGSIRADRFLYLPLVGFAGGAAWLVHRWSQAAPARPRLAAGAAVLVVIALAVRTHARNADWRDDETLFRAAREVSPRSFRVHKGLAQAILAGKSSDDSPSDARLDEAVASAEEAVRILESGTLPVSERSADTFLVLGLAHKAKADRLLQENREPEAEAAYQRARAVLERAVVIDRAANGDLREARRAAGHPEAEIQDLGNGRLYDVLGNVCLRMADTDCALEQFAYLRRIAPERSVSYMLSAWALTQKGRLDEAAVMTLEAWLLDARRDAVSVLVEIYRQLDPTLDVVTKDGGLKFDAPRVRGHLEQACRAHGGRARAVCHELGIDNP